ncbi:MAG: GNAT family N-acetyltransferase [Flavobacteriales bacterium]|jgi:RimJ/RimL family protein N-acetyltransferase|nr:GNAT family N-acetyltransferase [Flavobacteriales bacterium]MBK7246950.1 GNAT family N-acetyltransferase [Flavobacteriales bacterium]QQS72613.1 MAG: GNAT family N-acetyltransferase [Flavobacteriales bacterium]HQV39671.1 GNAT family N-acetyltransferase [Flavobacteriales bacterium]HQW33148.1 GNAT family N-acetyltransferase [Flavobacteriales bacterium]
MLLPIPSLEGLITERLIFRRPSLVDHSWWMEYLNSAEAIRFMPFTIGSEADCTLFIQRSLDRIARDGSCLNVVSERTSNTPVGMIGLLTQEVDGIAELEIGYHVLPSAWGHGYATEASMACKVFAQEHTLAPSVISLIDHDNTKSQAVAKRNGMHYEKDTVHRGVPAMVFRVGL